ncbi:MAG: 3-isopropylmalate dehydratase small subunit [Acidimicrobiia bacterium]|nr:3-isopropylmalate dehydratase small subunit [Acidimicrobiia bacterium]
MIEGTAWKFGDNVDTDVIIPGQYLILPADEAAEHVMAGIRPGFADEVSEGDVIVGGTNFGTGSSRESAPKAIKAAGIEAVVAESFARIFFRNCINVGLAPVECPRASEIEEGQTVRVDVDNGRVEVVDTGEVYEAVPLPEEIADILEAGGLVPTLKERFSS